MASAELHVELLLNRRVFALNGRAIGRIEEVCAELRAGECYVTEYLVGAYALFERLAAWPVGRELLRLFGATRRGHGYRVPWAKLDLSDATRPRLLCNVDELAPIEAED
jgi:sporulation protein YlmC with PRC-barrel domain